MVEYIVLNAFNVVITRQKDLESAQAAARAHGGYLIMSFRRAGRGIV